MQLIEKKKSEAVQKQKQAETLITEANDRLARAATAQNMTEILAAQALLQSGSVQLKEARKELDELHALPVAKKLKK
jgi:D-serine dehydratase